MGKGVTSLPKEANPVPKLPAEMAGEHHTLYTSSPVLKQQLPPPAGEKMTQMALKAMNIKRAHGTDGSDRLTRHKCVPFSEEQRMARTGLWRNLSLGAPGGEGSGQEGQGDFNPGSVEVEGQVSQGQASRVLSKSLCPPPH